MKTINNILQKVIEEAINAGLDVPVEILDKDVYKSSSVWNIGTCKFNRVTGRYRIYLSKYIGDDYNQIRETLAHEVVHTCPNCMNHGTEFKRNAMIMNVRYGYHIKTTADKAEVNSTNIPNARSEKARYMIKCCKCGNVMYRMKKSKIVKSTSKYRCSCGGKLVMTEINKMEKD